VVPLLPRRTAAVFVRGYGGGTTRKETACE
jgi:hypothetical protein